MNFLSLTACVRNVKTNETATVPITVNAAHVVMFEPSTVSEGGTALTLIFGSHLHVTQSPRDIAQKLVAH